MEVQKDKRQDSDWDADLEEVKDNVATALLGYPKQLLKALLYQTRRPPAGWPSRVIVKPASPKPKSETVPEKKTLDLDLNKIQN